MSALEIGDTVRTNGDTKHVSTGKVETISECRRYAKVRKTWGRTQNFTKLYAVKDLEITNKKTATTQT
jgi:hypothetical protein